MKINRNNYEQFFIDHMDGRLDASLNDEFARFLKENPDLKEELENFEIIDVNFKDSDPYNEKEQLKKIAIKATDLINYDNYNDYFIAAFEGDLSTSEQEEVNSFLKLNPQLQSEFDLFGISSVNPDTTIVFTDKQALKKYPFAFVKSWYKPIGIAAGILLLLGVINILNPIKTSTEPTPRAEVPAQIKSRPIEAFQAEITLPVVSSRTYQYAIDHSTEILPVESLTKMSSIQAPIQTYIANLEQHIQPIDFLLPVDNYDQIFKEMIIKEELLLASFGKSDPSTGNKLEKALWEQSVRKLKRRNNQAEVFSDENKRSKVNLWTLASIGIESFNVITGSNVNIERKPNKEGEKSKYILVNANSDLETVDQPNH